ncbi:uveal autoantigen with coiled-coil domains and ankyrin repeats protein-like isoform X1 [Myzus persicae]|uniref:uveal autoantigen with coiled-coil domains and ankyrin repeats protein-like isoform X1 n=2 Tax=Myzus persicae TaxID=13164 RepID=UPI000B9332D0|nr:uveal autoantigen with coiled-coil domains and ankyrin repeats protein-like isoform X1 [Myzus persicae]
MDFEPAEFIPVWEESPEVYYDPVILEHELDQLKKEYSEIKYRCSELEAENTQLRTAVKTKEKEKTDLHNLFRENTIKLPNVQAKVLELNKEINKLTTDKKNLIMANENSKEKREELEKKYKEVTESNTALVVANRKLDKIHAKCKLEKEKEIKDKLRTKTENDKTKAKIEELEIENKALKTQISNHEDELRFKEMQITGLARANKILETKVENVLIKLTDSEKLVTVLEKKIKTMNKECSESILRYSSLLKQNNSLQKKLDEANELLITVDELKENERGLYKQMNTFKRIILAEQLENKKLIEIAHQLEKQKTRFIYTGEDITIIKRKLEECMKLNLDLSKKFSNLDCPFYQSKYGKIEDKEPAIKCGSIKEKHYENKIFALEQVIKGLHLKYDSQEKKQLQYRGVVIKSLYDVKRAVDKEKATRALLEKQKYNIIYDKLEVLDKDSKIQKLEIQKDDYDQKCKLLNRQSTLLCRQVRNDFKKMESMKKNIRRANKVFEGVEQKNDELRNKTEQAEKLEESMKTQLEFNIKCQKRQQLEANQMKSTIEEFEKKIHKMQEELNNTKQKNDELTNAVARFQTSSEFDKKIQSKNINEAKIEIGKLSIENKKLTFENKCLSKLKDENKLLQSRLMTGERNLLYLQTKFDKLYNEKQRQINASRIPKL